MTLELDYPANFAYVGEVEVFLVDGSSEASSTEGLHRARKGLR